MAEAETVQTVGELRALLDEFARMVDETRKALEGRADDEKLPVLRQGLLDPRVLPPRGNPRCFVAGP